MANRSIIIAIASIVTFTIIVWAAVYSTSSTTKPTEVILVSQAISPHIHVTNYTTGQNNTYDTVTVQKESLLPRIIHQRWDSPMIPAMFQPWVTSWIKAHPPPRWGYYFWTKAGERALIKKHFPDFEEKYDQFPFEISRADSARVLMLEHYGGVYADLDTEVINPIDDLVANLSCFMAANQPLHHMEMKGPLPLNAVVGCQANEPFLRLVRREIMKSTKISDLDDAAGSNCWKKALDVYEAAGGTNITLTEPYIFMPTIDMKEHDKYLRKACLDEAYLRTVCPLRQKDCHRLVERNFKNFEPGPFTLTTHHWVHSYWFSQKLNVGSLVNISAIVPHAIVDPPLHGLQ